MRMRATIGRTMIEGAHRFHARRTRNRRGCRPYQARAWRGPITIAPPWGPFAGAARPDRDRTTADCFSLHFGYPWLLSTNHRSV